MFIGFLQGIKQHHFWTIMKKIEKFIFQGQQGWWLWAGLGEHIQPSSAGPVMLPDDDKLFHDLMIGAEGRGSH